MYFTKNFSKLKFQFTIGTFINQPLPLKEPPYLTYLRYVAGHVQWTNWQQNGKWGLVHTMPDKFENATLRAKTEQMFCVHTWKRNKCSASTLQRFRWLFTFKIWQFELWEVLSWHSKVFPPLFRDNNFVYEVVPSRTSSASRIQKSIFLQGR